MEVMQNMFVFFG